MAVENPVLYITFARPEYARQSFEAIKKAKPKKLYFYNNKARIDRPDEVKRNDEIRAFVKEIDWECDLKTFFRDEYVDVYTSLWGAIDWVFDNEEQAIIIEEDVVGSLAFFDYCDQLLPKYKENQKVWMIGGINYTPEFSPKGMTYFASRFTRIMGWAGWSDRWKKVYRNYEGWPEYHKSKEFKKYFGNYFIRKYIEYRDNRAFFKYSSKNAWDAVFDFSMMKYKSYCILPSISLTADVGIVGIHHNGAEKSINFSLPVQPYYDVSKEISVVPTSYDYKHCFYYMVMGYIVKHLKMFMFAVRKS